VYTSRNRTHVLIHPVTRKSVRDSLKGASSTPAMIPKT